MTARKEQIKAEMTAARENTLWLLDQVPEEFLRKRVHSFYSPIGWHFGHIARTEEYWIIGKALGRACLDEHYTFLFADLPENPKDNRVNLPSRTEITDYLAMVGGATFEALEEADLGSEDPFLGDGYGWEFALQHECQHQETICELMQLIQRSGLECADLSALSIGRFIGLQPRHVGAGQSADESAHSKLVPIPGGTFCMGSDDRHSYDNEKRAHLVKVEAFEMARTPVTASQWMEFMADGGYANQNLWSEDGWKWREGEQATMPEYWTDPGNSSQAGSLRYYGPHGLRMIHPDEPVSCVSWFEADAYACWAGMRLPTEAEWEYAARGPSSSRYPWGDDAPSSEHACFAMASWGPEPVGSHPMGASPFGLLDMAGNVWEWTSTPFLPYPGFGAFPYNGYSRDHMEGLHKVCRGGSWATSARILRCSFRNWYVPSYRQGFLGLRLAR
ncbi:MAG: SUMF1/EgtB/PvdO family nonheme iron enzyme [Fimbriimonadales bacterium]